MKSRTEITDVLSDLTMYMFNRESTDIKAANKASTLSNKLTKLHNELARAEDRSDTERITQIRADGDVLSKELDALVTKIKST